ncbi:MAG TPA: leucyl aminopeptidase [Acidimicrobiales bacterium]|nr:leucyl aminopeptidase [Acidimicrobiales bacterium]
MPPKTATKTKQQPAKAANWGGVEALTAVEVTHSAKVPDEAGTLGVAVFDDMDLPVNIPGAATPAWLRARGFTGKLGETLVLPGDNDSTVVAVGLGERAKLDTARLRRAAGCLARAASREPHIATTLASAAGSGAEFAQAVTEGVLLGSYRFNRHKSGANGSAEAAGGPKLRRFTLVGGPAKGAANGAARGKVLATATALARDLANEPAGTLSPTALANAAVEAGRAAGLQVTVWDEKKVLAERMGALLGVAAGSDEPCRFVRMEYNPTAKSRGTLAMVGKGITFDSGGLSLKTGEGMMTMKSDMSGAAAVLAAMAALPALAPPVRVVGYLCCTENMPSGKATRPGDVLVTRSGKTIEVLNTDAEGRLVLADGLAVAVEEQPDAVVDIATLTGAIITALGKKVAGVMGTSEALIEQARAAGDRVGEPLWPLPIPDEYRSQIDSEVADIKNIGAGPQNGAITGAMVLKEFVGDIPWAHLDIAGTARTESDDSFVSKGCTGWGARLLIDLAVNFRKPARRR